MKTLRVSIMATLALLLVLPGIAVADPVQATALEKTVGRVQPSVVFLDITLTAWVYDKYNDTYLNGGDPFTITSYCTGFVVDPDGYIATAGHCVDPASFTSDFLDTAANWALETDYYVGGNNFAQVRGWAADDYRIEGAGSSVGGSDNAGGGEPRGADIEVQAVWSTSSTEPIEDQYGDLTGEPHEARVEGFVAWNTGDTAILKVEASEPMVALPLAPEDEITTGTEIVSVGYPASVGYVSDTSLSNPSFKEGSISSIRTSAQYPVYETSAALSGGMSGGPTVNMQGEVVGINSFGITGEVESFEFIQAIGTLDDLLGDEGIDAEVGQPGTAYQAGLTAYYAGERDEAVEQLTKATEIAPDFDMASEFLTKTKALPESSSPIGPIVIGAGALLVLAGGLFLLVNRSRRKKNKGTPSGGQPVLQDAAPVIPAAPEMATTVTLPVLPDGQRYVVVPDKPQ